MGSVANGADSGRRGVDDPVDAGDLLEDSQRDTHHRQRPDFEGQQRCQFCVEDRLRRELLRRLHDAQRAAITEPDRLPAGLLLEGIVLRLEADLRWLEACERNWTSRKGGS